ncbi:hypothetical protein Hypma_007086 [Hypsizygus marmoreus]|uniref:Glycoside hydrolase family 92 protein n=1 Tax=Hypsizygus marmoreus TaxID=39966 RepID=A0A369KBJ2_HYPMA|nr:hypothetical protein Hypma_007086 [Hypsizygus marmoreus]
MVGQQQLLLLFALVAVTKQKSHIHAQENRDPFDYVNLLIGNGGDTPNGSGGMIPSTAPPFAMTCWVAQTHQNYVSVTPYNWTASKIHGFQATRQPAIWMGESGPVVVVPGVSRGERANIKAKFEERGLRMRKETEVMTPSYYSIVLDDGMGGEIFVEQTATSRVGHLRFTFTTSDQDDAPYILLESSRPSILTSTPTNISYPDGAVSIKIGANSEVHEICGSNAERQDSIITPTSTVPFVQNFRGYYCARFTNGDEFASSSGFGIVQNSTIHPGILSGEGSLLSGYALFSGGTGKKTTVALRIGTSFISVDQARRNIDAEIPGATSLDQTAKLTRAAWTEKLNLFILEGASDVQKEVFYTGVVHALQYPSEQHEQDLYYSGYDGNLHHESGLESYTGYSIWDTYRAEWAFLILFAPERVPGMVRSMLADYREGGWLPMWKNIVETNIMVGTHADSLIAEAVVKGVEGFDRELAWEAVWKDVTIPPRDDSSVSYFDREENVDYEVRAGLSTMYGVDGKGWVADDMHSESASRTLDYAYDDYAAYKLAVALNKPANVTSFLLNRALSAPFTLFNDATGFMEARNADGSWAGGDSGWTEGDKWAYSFDVVHDIPALIERRGGNASFVKSLDEHFNGGHNDHSNEPSHHIPYLYALAGAAYKTQERVREVAETNYNNTPTGLSGNEDCGQMSAWYIFSAMGFYPVNPVSGDYVVGSPFFDKVTINLPHPPHAPSEEKNRKKTLMITARGASTKPYIKSLTINGRLVETPIVRHEDIKDGGEIVFEMSDKVEGWGNTIMPRAEQDIGREEHAAYRSPYPDHVEL